MSQIKASTNSKYLEVVDFIRRRIASDGLKQGDRIATVAELRQTLDVSTVTVDRALFVLETEHLIVRQHGRGIFVAGAPINRTNLIGFAGANLLEIRSPYWMHLLKGASDAGHARGYELLLLGPAHGELERRVDGVIIHNSSPDDNYPLKKSLGALPTVSVMRASREYPSVVADDAQGIRDAVEHLVGLGHRRVAYLSWGLTDPVSTIRVAAYQAALRTAGIESNPDWVVEMHFFRQGGDCLSGLGMLNMEEWLRANWFELGCTAILCQNDSFASGVVRAAQKFGLRVPEDLSVVGYDATEDREPILTSVRVPVERIGFLAGEALTRQIEGHNVDFGALVLRTELVIGESTGPVK